MKPYVVIGIVVVAFFLGFVAGKMMFPSTIPDCASTYTFINPVLNCHTKYSISKANPIELKVRLQEYIAQEKESGRAEEISVYFRDLHDGPVLGIDENQQFIPASLLKLPVALTLFRLTEESQPEIFTRRLQFIQDSTNSTEVIQYFKPSDSVEPGVMYTVEEYIYHMLVYSDNMAYETLLKVLESVAPNRNLILETYRDLGLILPSSKIEEDLSTRLYATMFRLLYNASFLSVENSEKILSILAESTFDAGIASGVPQGIMVANKFGERFVGEQKQLHDCGIVYYPQNAYLLCVMTRGNDFPTLSHIIGEISRKVYEEMDKRANK